MTDKMQALNSFWNGFGWKAYDENTVPEEAPLPYITYEAVSDDFGHEVALTANLWERSSSWAGVTAKEKDIASYITRGGVLVQYGTAAFWLKKASPWAQRAETNGDADVRRIILNISIEYLD